METLRSIQCLNGNILKIIALVSMTVDHVGYCFFPDILIFRIIGRLAFPIFAFMIAEGCFYTRSRIKYISMILAVAVIMQCAFYFFAGGIYMCVLVTFLFGIFLIFLMQDAVFAFQSRKPKSEIILRWLLLFIVFILELFVCEGIPKLFPDSGFGVDYGIYGVLLPVVIYIPRLFVKNDNILRFAQAIATGLWLIPVTLSLYWYQWFSLLSVIILLLYNGKRGKLNLKYFFYIYYPVHLAVIYLVSELISL